MANLGSPESPLYVAVIGSGPSGFYAAEALLKQKDLTVRVDMFDRLPTPYGLVRGGVAPDHQKIKNVTIIYQKVAARPEFRFFGNVMLGRDILIEDLRKNYDQIIYAVGNESDRKLGIPGEDLEGSHSATEFVGWYNGHPNHREHRFDLSCENAVVIGIGNVAMDVTRILAQDPAKLGATDITDYALDALKDSRIKTIYLLGRRGPAQAAYSPSEISEIGSLESADLVVDPKEAELDELSQKALSDPADKKNVDYVQAKAKEGVGTRERKVRLRFLSSPVEVIEENGRIKALKIQKNKLVDNGRGGLKAQGTDEHYTVPAGILFRSVGYRGIPIPGVPFDDKAGKIPNADGRVLDKAAGSIVSGEYVVGWAKRGPSGLIGTNRADSVATVKQMTDDLAGGKIPGGSKDPQGVPEWLKAKKIAFVSFSDWQSLDKIEIEKGKAKGKIREKFSRIPEMLAALESAKQPN